MNFIDLLQSPKRIDTLVREMPPIPDTGWKAPQYYPELRGAIAIGVDLETKELDFAHGPGWGRGMGHIIGIGVSALWADGNVYKAYFPIRHEVESWYNLDANKTLAWLKQQLEGSQCPKVGANLVYDYGWLAEEGIYPAGPAYDVQFAEGLIDEEAYVALDVLANKYLGVGKTVDHVKEWVLKAFPNANQSNWRGFLWKTPPRLVGFYGEDDAALPLRILPIQWQIMEQEGSLDLFLNTECPLIPILVQMRRGGITVDLAKAQELREQFTREIKELYAKLVHISGVKIESVNAPSQLAPLFDTVGITYPRTATGKPSFTKEYLTKLAEIAEGEIATPQNTVAKIVTDIREREKLIATFLDGYILNRSSSDGTSNSRGLIYCSFIPNKSENGGAKTGRFASADPNLQNIPARSKVGKLVRYAFVPDYGHMQWHKKDESQIEYRLFAHYAVGPGAVEMQQRYINDKTTDYHNDTALAVAAMRAEHQHFLAMDAAIRKSDAAWALFRKPMKNVNFGLLYGQTEKSLAYKLGWTDEQARDFFALYHGSRPFVRTTMQAIEQEVHYYGYITTAGGRRLRFNRWEPLRTPKGEAKQNYAYDHAVRLFGANIKRAFAYRGVNYKFQGSAAEVLKDAMVLGYQHGVYAVTGYPKVTVHDELGWSQIDDSKIQQEAFHYMEHLMETGRRQFRVPLKADTSVGQTWGHCA